MTKAKDDQKQPVGTPTINGVIKGRPGKGRVLSLEQRAKCYAGHRMTDDNTFRYTAKRVQGKPKPIMRAWCKRCRTASRKRSVDKRKAEALALAEKVAASVAKGKRTRAANAKRATSKVAA